MERKVEEIFEIKLKVVEVEDCIGKCQECFYRGFDECFESDTKILCYPFQRQDRKNVIYQEIKED